MFILPVIIIVISIAFVTVLTFVYGKPELKQKNTLNANFEICFSIGVFLSFFLPWVTFTTDNIGLNAFGLNMRTLANVSWAKLIQIAWDIYDLLNQVERQSSDKQMAFTGLLLFVCLPLFMAMINIFLLIAGKVRGWSFYTGIITLLWTATCLFGYHEVHGMVSFGIGFAIGTTCALYLIISSLITMLFNPKQHLSFLLGHFSLIIFGMIIFLSATLAKVMGIDPKVISTIPSILFIIIALVLTFVCDYYLFMYLTRQKEKLAVRQEQAAGHTATDNEPAETLLDQHWMFCSKCGTKCKDYLKFCPRCGFALHPEKEMQLSKDSSYAPPVKLSESTECNPIEANSDTPDRVIPIAHSPSQPLVTETENVLHAENILHPRAEDLPKPTFRQPIANKKWGMWVLIACAVLLAGLFSVYLLWYKPYAIDRDAPRYYTFTNLNLRSSQITDVDHNILKLLPYGTELITYTTDAGWASVKVDGQKGFVASNLILSSDDFALLNSVWGNVDAKEYIGSAKCRLAVLDYYKRNQLRGGGEWQIYARRKEDRKNTVYYRKLYNPDSKFTDFVFIMKNNRTKERVLVIYSFEDETEKPIYRTSRQIYSSESVCIGNITSSKGWIDIVFTDGDWIQISLSGQ